MPNATVTVSNTATNEKSQGVTGADGNYTIPLLKPGAYNVSAEAPGFKTEARNAIELQVASKVTVDFTMEIGQVSEQVTVTAAAPRLDETSANRGETLDNTRVTQLPLNGRIPSTSPT